MLEYKPKIELKEKLNRMQKIIKNKGPMNVVSLTFAEMKLQPASINQKSKQYEKLLNEKKKECHQYIKSVIKQQKKERSLSPKRKKKRSEKNIQRPQSGEIVVVEERASTTSKPQNIKKKIIIISPHQDRTGGELASNEESQYLGIDS